MKSEIKNFLLNNLFRLIQLAFMIPLGVYSLVTMIISYIFDINTVMSTNLTLIGIGTLITIVRLILILAPLILITSFMLGSRGKAYIGYTRGEIAFHIAFTIIMIVVYGFISGFWFYCNIL